MVGSALDYNSDFEPEQCMTTASPDGLFAKNLRYLSDREVSISNLCHKLSINRQQYNKYLAGTHLPSRRNGLRIAEHFGVPYGALFETDFSGQDDAAWAAAVTLMRSPVGRSLLAASSGEDISRLHGCYQGYHFSSIRPGKIVSSLVIIQPWQGLTACVCLERFPDRLEPQKRHEVLKAHGLVLLIDGKLHIIELEKKYRKDLGYMSFSLPPRGSSLLFGVRASVQANHMRGLFTSTTILRRVESSIPLRQVVRATTIQNVEDAGLPEDIIAYLRGDGVS